MMRFKFKQCGGTVLGFIIGVMFGLAIATGVAIYVAKVPVPFVNKNTSRTSDQDAAEQEKNKGWDPNAALRGRIVVQPAPPASSPASEAVVNNAPAPTATPPSASRPPAADPLGDFAAARAGTPPAPAAADPFIYFVQAGAFRTPDDAEAQRARLSLMGVEARVSEGDQSGRVMYRVRVGPMQNKDAADRVKDRLSGDGFEAALVRVPR
jgi:cell division protein FtsN